MWMPYFSRSVFKFDQRGVSSHLVVYANKYSLDYAADFGFNIVFHLHGLIDQHGVSRLDFRPGFTLIETTLPLSGLGDHRTGDGLGSFWREPSAAEP